jgi:hypothetical protein
MRYEQLDAHWEDYPGVSAVGDAAREWFESGHGLVSCHRVCDPLEGDCSSASLDWDWAQVREE